MERVPGARYEMATFCDSLPPKVGSAAYTSAEVPAVASCKRLDAKPADARDAAADP